MKKAVGLRCYNGHILTSCWCNCVHCSPGRVILGKRGSEIEGWDAEVNENTTNKQLSIVYYIYCNYNLIVTDFEQEWVTVQSLSYFSQASWINGKKNPSNKSLSYWILQKIMIRLFFILHHFIGSYYLFVLLEATERKKHSKCCSVVAVQWQ